MDAALIVTLVFSIVTAILVVVQLIINFGVQRKARNIKAVTEQRSAWIQKVRELFGDVIELFDNAIDALISNESNYNNRNRDASVCAMPTANLRKKFNQLRLMLNFEDEIDKTLLLSIEDLICRAELETMYTWMMQFPDYDVNDFIASKELVVLRMSIYLKSEWERLKKETRKGETSSKYFKAKHKELETTNKELIDKLSQKAYRIKISDIQETINDDSQIKRQGGIYNPLHLLKEENAKKEK